MAETIVRKIPLKRIKSIEEYENSKKDLQYYLDEHRWFTSHDSDESRLKDIDQTLDEYREKLGETKRDSEERKEVYCALHALKVKYLRVKEGTYDSLLRNNIKAEMIMIDEYETQLHKIPLGKVLKGLLTGDKEVQEYARKKLTFVLNNSYGMVEQPYDLRIEPNTMSGFAKEYRGSFVETDTSEFSELNEEKGLAVYREEPGIIQKRVAKMIQRGEELILGGNNLAVASANGRTMSVEEMRIALGGHDEKPTSNLMKSNHGQRIRKEKTKGSEEISK